MTGQWLQNAFVSLWEEHWIRFTSSWKRRSAWLGMQKNKRNNIPIIIIIKATTTTQMCKSAAGKCAKIRRVLASSFAIGNSIRAIEGSSSSSSIGGGGGCGSLCCKWECCNLKWRITGSNTYEDYLGWCTATSQVQRERTGKCDCILWIVNARVLHFHLASIYNLYEKIYRK